MQKKEAWKMYSKMTTLGLDERIERVLAYSLFWFSGLFFFLVEKNRTVRWHAVQSMVSFGAISLLIFGVNMLRSMLSWVPIIGVLTTFGLSLLINILWWAMLLLWIWLMIMAWMKPDYRLPIISDWVRYFV